MRYFVLSNKPSKGARALTRHIKLLGHKAHYRKASLWPDRLRKPKLIDTVINWGNSYAHPKVPNGVLYYNAPTSISGASNKLAALTAMAHAGVPVPEFTTDRNVALGWLPDAYVVCRKLLRASCGRGIVLAKSPEEVVQAPLYVKYRRKTHEYRVHVVKGTITHIHEKRLKSAERRNDNAVNKYIRNIGNDWVFCSPRDPIPDMVRTSSLQACTALNLDFGAVDVIYNAKFDKCYVLEVNTAPGMSIGSETAIKYAKAFAQ